VEGGGKRVPRAGHRRPGTRIGRVAGEPLWLPWVSTGIRVGAGARWWPGGATIKRDWGNRQCNVRTGFNEAVIKSVIPPKK
jgi:hypothetical protein